MPDLPLAGQPGGPYDPNMEARIARLEEDMHDVKASVGRLEAAVIRIESLLTATLPHLATKAELNELRGEMIAGFATLPHLATKAEFQDLRTDMVGGLAEKPSKTYMWGILAVLLTAYACGLAALAILK